MKETQFIFGEETYHKDVIYFLDKSCVDFIIRYHRYKNQTDYIGYTTFGGPAPKVDLATLYNDYHTLIEIIGDGRYRTYNNKKIELKNRTPKKLVNYLFIIISSGLAFMFLIILVKFIGLQFFYNTSQAKIIQTEPFSENVGDAKILRGYRFKYEFNVNSQRFYGNSKVDFLVDDCINYEKGDSISIRYVRYFCFFNKVDE